MPPALPKIHSLLILSESIKILKTNPKPFLAIYALAILPLSLLLSTLFLLSQPLLTKISEKELTAAFVTHFEALLLRHEIRKDTRRFVLYQFLFFVPSYVLSLSALIATATSTALAVEAKRADVRAAVAAVRLTWRRQLVTSLFVHGILVGSCVVARAGLLMVGSARVRLGLSGCWAALEVGVMAVLGMGMVVSVLEERFGLEALCTGWGLMEGRRFCGWSLGGLVVLVMSGIRWWLMSLMDGPDWRNAGVEKFGVACLLGLVILFCYVVNTVFYCDCSKRHNQKVENKPLV